MKMSVDQALRKARSLSPDEAAALFGEILERFPSNKRIREQLDALSRPKIVSAPDEDLDAIIALYQHGRLTQALDRAAEVLTRYPNSEVLNNIAAAIQAALGRYAQAVEQYDKALALAPNYFEAWSNRGNALNGLKRYDEAIESFNAAIRLNPDFADAYTNRSVAMRHARRLEDALASANTSIRLNPTAAEAYNNRGLALMALHRRGEALADFNKAIALKQSFSEALVNRGSVLRALGRSEEAVESFDRALAITPTHVLAHTSRGGALANLKRLDEALASYRLAQKYAPNSERAKAEVRNLEAHICAWGDNGVGTELPPLGVGDDVFPPFYMLRFDDSPQRQLFCAKNWAAKECGAGWPVTFPPRRDETRIRIGYFSADFHNHATMHLMARLFELHDRDRFEIHAFSYGVHADDAMRQRLLDNVDAFHEVGGFSDEAVAELARAQSIDIAVDLKGHTLSGRLGIFAHRAAPVQVGHVGYPGTTGTDFIDYFIADAVTIPVEHQRFYSEKIAYLPNSYQPNDNLRPISHRIFSRAELGLPDHGFIFCCFNASYKIGRAEFDIWARLLARIDGSVLWLFKDNDWAADNLRREAKARGLSPDRLVFAEKMPLAEHLARLAHADLFLDTFNVNAHTTASDALWAGVPVLTKLGSSFAARVAGSLLHALDMPELVTQTPAAYEQRGLEIAIQPAELTALKAKLARNRLNTPLFDTEQYTRDIEALYQRLLQQA